MKHKVTRPELFFFFFFFPVHWHPPTNGGRGGGVDVSNVKLFSLYSLPPFDVGFPSLALPVTSYGTRFPLFPWVCCVSVYLQLGA